MSCTRRTCFPTNPTPQTKLIIKTHYTFILFALLLIAAVPATAEIVILTDQGTAQQKAEKRIAQQKAEKRITLDLIVLPQEPTREQCAAYIETLRDHLRGRGRVGWSNMDPEVEKLKAVPEKHRDLLFDEVLNETTLRNYAFFALKDTDARAFRDRVIASLPDKPQYITIVTAYGWYEQARPFILKRLASAQGSVMPIWFQAFVEVAKPEHYAKLHELTTRSLNEAPQFLSLLATLPDYDMANTTNACWRLTADGVRKSNSDFSRRQLAPLVASYGNVEALGVLVDRLHRAPNTMMQTRDLDDQRLNVIRLIDFRGSDRDIKEWFDANRDKLVFDNLTKRFVVPEDF